MKLASRIFSFVAIAIIVCAVTASWDRHALRASGGMPQQAYVWQRSWTPEVREAVRTSASSLASCVVLGAEVSFRSGRMQVARIAPDYASFKQNSLPIGIALRIGPYPGPFANDDAVTVRLADLAGSMIAEAAGAGVRPTELQIDFDAAESKLDGYCLWIEAIRRRISPMPVTITALPSWLKHGAFARLARCAGAYVLQVHSLRRPRSPDSPVALCNPADARAAVEQAARIGVPFRVALPTYGYLIAFNQSGRFIGLSAEAPSETWPSGTQVRALRADPNAMADLVRRWTVDRPQMMQGIIWYRLATSRDALNWRWRTLEAVMTGRSPSPTMHVTLRQSEPRLFEVELSNTGDADAPLDCDVLLRWEGASLAAADALGGFEYSAAGGHVRIHPTAALDNVVLSPGDSRSIGWLRLSQDKEVRADVILANP